MRSFYRIAALLAHFGDRRPQAKHPQREAPIVTATQPDAVWCWDITRIPGPITGVDYFLFAMIDLFSRFVVGWMLAEKENAELAAHFLRESVRHAQRERDLVYLTNHSDRGAAMMALKTQAFLDEAGIKRSYSRPRVSNDNAFIEAFFKTLKYNATYQEFFQSKLQAEQWIQDFVARYQQAPHSGLKGYTPFQAYTGTWHQAWHQRQQALNAYFQKYPKRFRKEPLAKPLPNYVSLNVSKPNPEEMEALTIPDVYLPGGEITGAVSWQPWGTDK